EVVRDGVNGLLFEAEDAADLRRCLARFIAEPELVGRLCAGAPAVKTMAAYAGELEGIYAQLCAAPSPLPSLQKSLLEGHQLHTAPSREYEQLRGEAGELDAQTAALGAGRDRLGADALRLGQERDQALAAAAELGGILDVREGVLRDRDARLAAIYA